jgi:hypothetical protein
MAANTANKGEADPIRPQNGRSETFDPRDTDHPTGTEQAAENAANESPS